MRLYRIKDGGAVLHFVFAGIQREARRILQSHLEGKCGLDSCDVRECMNRLSFRRLKSGDKLTVDHDNSEGPEKKTAAEWIEMYGQKAAYFVCSEY